LNEELEDLQNSLAQKDPKVEQVWDRKEGEVQFNEDKHSVKVVKHWQVLLTGFIVEDELRKVSFTQKLNWFWQKSQSGGGGTWEGWLQSIKVQPEVSQREPRLDWSSRVHSGFHFRQYE